MQRNRATLERASRIGYQYDMSLVGTSVTSLTLTPAIL